MKRSPLKRSPFKAKPRDPALPATGKPRARITQVSKKRARYQAQYLPLRAKFLEDNPICERCKTARSVDLHHRANRSATARAFLDPSNWVALCRPCHGWVGANRVAAVAEGYAQWGWDYRGDGAA